MAAHRRAWDCSRAGDVAGVSFETLRAPKGALKRSTGCQSQRSVRWAVFTLPSDNRLSDPALRQRASVRTYPVRKAVNAAEHENEDDYDDGDDDDDDDEGVTFLQWQMPSTPLNAEPVSDEDEQYQLDTITAGNVPALFLGKAYTNAAVNIIGMHKMQKLLEDMYYHLVAPKPDREAINTIGLLLRAPPSLHHLSVSTRVPYTLVVVYPLTGDCPCSAGACQGAQLQRHTPQSTSQSENRSSLPSATVTYTCLYIQSSVSSCITPRHPSMQVSAGCHTRIDPTPQQPCMLTLQRLSLTEASTSTPMR